MPDPTAGKDIHQRLLHFVSRANWVVFVVFLLVSPLVPVAGFSLGVVCGGLLVTGNFHLAYRSLNRSFQGGRPPAFPVVMAKHYLRFLVTGVIIFLLISNGIGSPLGLLLGLSVVVVSLLAASVVEARRMVRAKSQGG
ncbi:MAG: ATP synthase subunit I [Desulfobacterales bacterium]|jgi:hypothetical protein